MFRSVPLVCHIRFVSALWTLACLCLLPVGQGSRDRLRADGQALSLRPASASQSVISDSLKSEKRADLVFVLDGSGSLLKEEWEQSLAFVVKVAGQFSLDPEGSTARVVQFSSNAKVYCDDQDQHTNDAAFAACAENIKQEERWTRGDLGLRAALDILKRGCKTGHHQLVFFVGDGDLAMDEQQKSDALAATKEIRAGQPGCPAKVFSLAVGGAANVEELQQLASEDRFFYRVEDFEMLETVVKPLLLVTENLLEGGDADPMDANDLALMVAATGGGLKTFQCGNLCLNEAFYGVFNVKGQLVREGFFEVKERWEIIVTLGQLVEIETEERILSSFIPGAVAVLEEMLGEGIKQPSFQSWIQTMMTSSESDFAAEFGSMLSSVAKEVDVNEALELVAEYDSLKALGLDKDVDLGGGGLDELRTRVSGRMLTFASEARRYEKRMPLVNPKWVNRFWTAWQNAWGTVRVYVKVTTQCKVVVPPEYDGKEKTTFRTRPFQAFWKECASAKPFPSFQFPSAVAACARRDEHDQDAEEGRLHDNDRMVRYLGCGERGRMKGVEPPVTHGPRTLCRQEETMCDFNKNLCPPGSSTTGGCRLYGPFWGVYSGKIDHIFGVKNPLEEKREDAHVAQCNLDMTESSEEYAEAKCGVAQVEAFKSMINEGTNNYIYGALPALPVSLAEQYKFGWKAKGWGDSPFGVDGPTAWPLPQQRSRDPPMGHVLREVQQGSTVVLLAYGYSGAGKTSALVGSASNAIDGALSLFLQQYSRFIEDIHVGIVEVYGRLSPEDGRMVKGVGQGLWGFKVKPSGVKMEFMGDSDAFHVDGKMDFSVLQSKLDAYKVSLRKDIFRSVNRRSFKWESKVLDILALVEEERKRQTSAEKALKEAKVEMVDPMAHIRGTPNNPSSSRGTLFCSFDFTWKNGGTGSIVVIDLAGSEDPVTLASSFAQFVPEPASVETGYTSESRAQRVRAQELCGAGSSSDKLIRQNLHLLGDHTFMDHDLAECLQFRDFLKECTGPVEKMATSCGRVKLHGKVIYLKPNLDAEVSYVRKSYREPDSFRPFTFEYGDVEFGPVPVETVLAHLHGADDYLDWENFGAKSWKDWGKDLDKDCNRRCDFSVPKGAFGCYGVVVADGKGDARNLYADLQLENADRDLVTGDATGIDWRLNRCLEQAQPQPTKPEKKQKQKRPPSNARNKGKSPKPKVQKKTASVPCTRVNDPFGGDTPGEEPKSNTRGCRWPARVWQSDPERGRWTIERQLLLEGAGKTKFPKQEIPTVRAEFWDALQAYIKEYKQKEVEIRETWDRHVAYFTQVIGPMVEEALFINEMLNQMKNFLAAVSFWGQNSELVPWPEGQNAAFGEAIVGKQTIDVEDTNYGGYDKDRLVRPATRDNGEELSYFDELNERGSDPIMGLSIFEFIRRGSLKDSAGPEKYRVLFGTFVRTDRPNGDPDCSGAKQSLDFAQQLLEAIGVYREDQITKLTCQ